MSFLRSTMKKNFAESGSRSVSSRAALASSMILTSPMISAAAGVACKAAIRVMNMSLRMGADRQPHHGEFMAGLLPANHTAPLYSAGERRLDTAKAAKFKSCEAHHFAVTAVAHRASLRGQPCRKTARLA